MRILGNIERFLVLGIVVVIGTILVVAITGARDLENERNQVAAQTKGGGKKNDATTLRSSGPIRGTREAQGAPANETPTPPRPQGLDKEVVDAIDLHSGLTHPQETPAPGPLPNETNGTKVADAPEIIPDGTTPPTPPKSESQSPAPTDPPTPAASPATEKSYVYEVQKGDTLERIARTLYGDGQLWKEILAANSSLADASRIRVGDKLKLPKAPTNASSAVTLVDGATVHATPEKPASGGFKRVTSSEEYKVQKGDTLMSIAAANYGTKAAWRVILDANSSKLADKDSLKVGTVLKLPAN